MPRSWTHATSRRIADRSGYGLGGAALAAIQLVILFIVLAVTVLAAWRVPDRVTSFALVSAASLAALPVTWYHYPAAMLPVAIALAVRSPASRPWLVGALVLVDLAIAVPRPRHG